MVNIDVAPERSILWIWVFTLIIVTLVAVGLFVLA
jgi:hypothetical protein